METKDKAYIIDENLKQSVWKDSWMFSCLLAILAVNYNYLGGSWVTDIFVWLIFFCFVSAYGSTKKMTKAEAYSLLKEEFDKND